MMLDVGAGYLRGFIRKDVLPSPPRRSGEGIHRALYDLARVLTPWRTAAQREAILRGCAALCDRDVPETEIQAALRDGARRAWKPSGSNGERAPQSPQPKFNLEAFKRFVAGAPLVDGRWLAERSPIPVDEQTPVSFLHPLFREGEKVIVFDDVHGQGQAVWTHPGPSCDPHCLYQFVHGSQTVSGSWPIRPMASFMSTTQENYRAAAGRASPLGGMVVESDRTDISSQEWLTAIARLALPIVAIVETGGRLAHGLCRVDADSKEKLDDRRDELRPTLVKIGADVSSLSAVRLTRLPCCERLGWQDAAGPPHGSSAHAIFWIELSESPRSVSRPLAKLRVTIQSAR